jgi:hypothetical protein
MARETAAGPPISADPGLAQARKSAPYFKKLMTDMPMHAGMDTVREADHDGHHIVVRTVYTVTIDGKPFDVGLGVNDDGNVYYHGMPNVGFASALDLVKAVIDTFPADFASGATQPDHEEHGHEGHHHGHSGMPMRGRAATAKTTTPKRKAKKRKLISPAKRATRRTR